MSAHVVLAVAAAGATSLARSIAAPGTAPVIEAAGALVVAAIAISAALRAAGGRSAKLERTDARRLLASRSRQFARCHGELWAARIVCAACEPSTILAHRPALPDVLRAAAIGVVGWSARVATRKVPLWGPVSGFMEAYESSRRCALFIRELETAAALCRLPETAATA